jgi:hypothetical protein
MQCETTINEWGCVKMSLGEMYGRTTVRPIVDTATINVFSTIRGRRFAVVASPSGR